MPPFNNVYFLGAKPNQLTSVIRTPDGDGYVATGNFEGATLLELSSTGTLSWARRYSLTLPTQAVMVRRLRSSEFIWVGQMGNDDRSIPIVVHTDPLGNVIAARQLALPGSAQSRAIEIAVDGHGFWIGGVVWREPGNGAAWLARFDLALNPLWVRTFQLPQSSWIDSLFPSLDGGVIGVGRLLADEQGTRRPRMYAFKVAGGGFLQWAHRYDVSAVDADPLTSDQWLADIDRDPRSGVAKSFVVGTITGLCTQVASLGCNPTPSAAMVASLDETTGALRGTFGIWSSWKTWGIEGVTVVDELVREETVFGGSLSDGAPGSEEGLLVRLRVDSDIVLSATAYGDEAGPFDTRIVDLRRSRIDEVPVFDFGFAFVTRQHQGDTLERPNLVRTDELGSAHSYPCCERKVSVNTRPITLEQSDVYPEPINGDANPIELLAENLPLNQKPCADAGKD
jgi:hypothetical protein